MFVNLCRDCFRHLQFAAISNDIAMLLLCARSSGAGAGKMLHVFAPNLLCMRWRRRLCGAPLSNLRICNV